MQITSEAEGESSILIIEEDTDLRHSLAEILTAAGYRVDHAADGRHALRRLQIPPPPGLILMDWMMPVMDGRIFRNLLKEDPVLARIPVAILTTGPLSESQAASLDAVGQLTKPVDLEELFSLVARHCGR